MKKHFIEAIALIAAIALAGCGNTSNQNTENKQEKPASNRMLIIVDPQVDFTTGSLATAKGPEAMDCLAKAINVGVWKDSGGKLAYSTKNGLAAGAVGTSDCHVDSGIDTTDNYGDVYGNGTRNAVLGYMWGDNADAFIETAQRLGNNDD